MYNKRSLPLTIQLNHYFTEQLNLLHSPLVKEAGKLIEDRHPSLHSFRPSLQVLSSAGQQITCHASLHPHLHLQGITNIFHLSSLPQLIVISYPPTSWVSTGHSG